MQSQSLLYVIFFFLIFSFGSCSFHYQEGVRLQEAERWEEAAIEFHLAFVEDPDDEEIRQRLTFVNQKVAAESMTRYYQHLQKNEHQKAYRRLVAATLQDPELQIAKNQLVKWYQILIAGKIELEFEQIRSNVRLADEMQLVAYINTPDGRKLKANIANESGFFFAEDVVYQQPFASFALYSLDSIGLELIQRPYQALAVDEENQAQEDARRMAMRNTFSQKNFYRFITFRNLLGNISGNLASNEIPIAGDIFAVRPSLWSQENPPSWWNPPRSLNYELRVNGKTIQVLSKYGRNEFTPDVMYLNQETKRAFIDFGKYHIKQEVRSKRWLLRRMPTADAKSDYFTLFSNNLALYPYFFYTNGGYRFSSVASL